MIRLTHVSKNYAAPRSSPNGNGTVVQALNDVSLEIKAGEFIAVTGPSGCGKSTLLHLVGGLDQPSSGEVWIQDRAFHQMNEQSLSLFRRRNVGVIFQFFNLLPQLTALENVEFPLRLLNVSPSESEARASALLNEVDLSSKHAHLPSELSGGEQQRVAIARALVHRPHIVLADEPTGNLDSASSTTVLTLFKNLQQTYQLTLLLVTHSEEVSAIAQRTIKMQDGHIILNSQ